MAKPEEAVESCTNGHVFTMTAATARLIRDSYEIGKSSPLCATHCPTCHPERHPEVIRQLMRATTKHQLAD